MGSEMCIRDSYPLGYVTTHYIRTTAFTPVCHNTLHPYHFIHSGVLQHITSVSLHPLRYVTTHTLYPLRCVTTHYIHTTASTPVCQHTTSVPLHSFVHNTLHKHHQPQSIHTDTMHHRPQYAHTNACHYRQCIHTSNTNRTTFTQLHVLGTVNLPIAAQHHQPLHPH